MSKIERFLSDPRYQALDDAGKKEKLDLFFNKYVTQDARYSPLDEEGKARVYSKFMSKYYGEPEAKAPDKKQDIYEKIKQMRGGISLTEPAVADKTSTDAVESYMAKTHRGSADIGYSRGAASVADEPKPKNIFEAMDIGFTQGLTSVLSAPQMIGDIIQGDIYSANYTQGMIDQRLKDAGYDDMDMASAIKNKDLKKAGGMALKVFSQSAPVTALWLVHPLIGDVFGALMPTAASKYTQLDREMPELSTGKKIASAALAGTWEALSEEIGNRLAFMNKFVKIGRPNLAKLIAKEVGKTKVINAFAGGAMGAVGEGFEEYLSFNGEYWTDVMLGITDHDPKVYREGAINSTLLGIGAGGVQGGITTTVSSLLNARYSDIQGKLDKAASIDLSRYNGTDRWNAAKNTKMLAQKTQAAVQLAREGDTEGAIQLAKENLSAAQRILDKEQSSAIKTIGMYNSLLIDTATQYQEREEGLPVPSGVGAGEQATATQEPTQQATESEPQSIEDTIVTLVQEGNIEAAENALNEAVKNRVTGINVPYLRNLVNESKADAERIAKEEADQKARRDIIDKYGEYADMSHSALQDEAKKRGLKADGKSTDIMARLKESDEKPKDETTPAKPVVRESLTANKTIETQQDRAIKESLIAEEAPKKASKYESMGYNALQKEAKKRGINSFGIKKAELIRQLEEKEASIEKTKAERASVYDNSAEIEGIVESVEPYSNRSKMNREALRNEKKARLRSLDEMKARGVKSVKIGAKQMTIDKAIDVTRKSMGILLLDEYDAEQKVSPIEYAGKSDVKIDRNLVDAIKSGEAWVDNSPTSEEWNIAIAEMKEEGSFWGIKDQDIIDQGTKIMDDIDELLDEIDNIENATKEYLDELHESGSYISDEEIKEIVDEDTKRIKEIEAKIRVLQKKHKDLWDNAKSDQSSPVPVTPAEDSKAEGVEIWDTIPKEYSETKEALARIEYIQKEINETMSSLSKEEQKQFIETNKDMIEALFGDPSNFEEPMIRDNKPVLFLKGETSEARYIKQFRKAWDMGHRRYALMMDAKKNYDMDSAYFDRQVRKTNMDMADAIYNVIGVGRIKFPEKQSPITRSTFHTQYREAQKGKLPKEQIDAQLKLYDAMMDTYAREMGITIDEAYAEVIDSVTADEPVEGTARRSGARYQAVEEKNLVTIHNIPADGIEKVNNRGGMVMPSIAIIDATKTKFTGFGDASLIGDEKMIQPSAKQPLYTSDAYTPTYPKVYEIVKMDKNLEALAEYLSKKTKKKVSTWDLEANIEDQGSERYVASLLYGVMDYRKAQKEAIRTLEKHPINIEEKLYAGRTPNGNRRYIPHTAENALKIMKKDAKDDPSVFWGTNSLRGALAERFSSLAQAKKNRDMILSEAEMKPIEEATNKMFEDIAARANAVRKNQRAFYHSDIASDIYDMAKYGWGRIADLYKDDSIKEAFRRFISHLRSLPTQYFEYKPQRVVGINEFVAAVIPTGTKASTAKALRDAGLKVVKYEAGNDEARFEAVKRVSEEMGVRYQTIQGYIQKMPNGKYRIGIMQPNVTTGLHEQAHLGKSLMEIMANKSPAWASRLKAAEEWCGVKDGKWTTEAEEKFANGYVKFLADGSAPNGKLKTIFAKIKEWIGSILQGIADVKNIDVSSEMRGVYLAMLGVSEGKRNLTSEQKVQSIKLKYAMKQDATSDPLKLEAEIDSFADSNDLILEGKRTGNKTSFYLNRIDDGKTMIEIHHSNGEYEVNGYHAANNQEVMEQVTRILGDTRYQTTDMPSAAEIAEAERQMAEVRAKYEGTGWYKSLPTWEIITRMNNVTDTPYNQKIKEGELFRDSVGDDPYIYETRYVNPKDYIDKVHLEGETYDKVVSMPTTQKYIEWYKQGYEPPPMTLIIHYKNGLTPTERRRWVAAIEAGVDKVPALVEIGRASEMLNSPLYLKAPNGKPTNLNERQWLQVRTQLFKDWFGDWINDPKNASKVVEKKTSSRDANGEPMPMYHGTIYDFTEFKANMPTHNTDMFGRGYETKRNAIFFADNPINSLPFTNKYGDKNGFTVGGRTIPVFLNMKNPFYANDEHTDAEYESLRELGYTKYDVDNIGWQYLDDELGDKFVSDLQKLGYDGIILNDEHPDTGDIVTSYAVFTPTQIKSATGNVGTFSESNDIRYQIDNAIQSASPDMQDRIAKIMEKQKKVQQAANVTYRELAAKIGRTTSVYEWDSMMRKSLVTAIRKAFPGAAPMNIEKYAALEETLGELDPGLEDHAKDIKKIKAQLRRMVAMDKKFRDALEDVSGFSDIADIPFEGLFSALENTNPTAYDIYFRDETFEILLKALPRIKKSFGEQFTMQTLQRIVDVTLNGSDPAVGRAEFELAFVQPHRVLAELFGKAGIKTINYAYNGTLAVAAYENEYAQHLTEINRLLMTADNNRGSAYEGDDLDIIGRTIFEVDGNSEITDKLETIQARLAEWAENNNAIINPNDVDGIYKAKEYLKDTMRGFIAEWNANPEHERKIGIREDYDNPRKYNWGTASDITTKRGKYLYTPGNARARSRQDISEGLNYETNIFSAYSNYMYAMTRYMAFYDLANYVEDSSVLYPSKGKVGQKKIASGFDLDLSLAQRKSSAYASGMLESYVKNVIGYHKKDTPMGRLVKSARTNVYSSMLAANIAMTVLNYNQRNLIHAVVDQSIAMQVKKDIAFWTGLFSPSNEEYPVLSGIMQAYVTANQSLIAELSAEAKRYANEGRTALTRAYYRHTAKNSELLRLSPFSLAELGNRAYAHAAGVYQITQNSEAYKNYTASGISRHRAMEKALAEDSSLRRAAITYGGILNAEINADANRAFSPYFFSGASKINSLAIFIRYGVTISLLELRTYGGARDIRSLLSPDLFKLLTSGNVKAATAAQTIQAGVIMKSMLDQKRIAELVRRGDISTAKTSKNLITVEQVKMVREAITWALDEQAKHTTEEYHAIIRGKRGARQAMAALMAFSISEVILRSALELLFSLIPWWLGKKKFIETDVIENVAAVFGLFQTTKTMANVRLGSTLAPDLGAYNPTAKTTTKALSQYVLRLTPYAGLANYMGKVFTGKYFSDIFWDEVYD